MSPTLSCGQILNVFSSGLGSFTLFFSYHFKIKKKIPVKIPTGALPFVDSINDCGSFSADGTTNAPIIL